MQANLHVLMTVFNEASFVDHALRACIPYVKSVTVVEGAYQETIACGASARSNDGTIEIVRKHVSDKVALLFANEKSDAQQRNIGLQRIKNLDPNSWLLIIDGDEVYEPFTFKLIAALTRKMDLSQSDVAVFQSLTFVNDFDHYCIQNFPRLFRVAPNVRFVNDNAVCYGEKMAKIISCPHIKFHHYSFCKNKERFALKKQWWETRFNKPFDYSWRINEHGKIEDPNHEIKKYTGQHPITL